MLVFIYNFLKNIKKLIKSVDKARNACYNIIKIRKGRAKSSQGKTK
nr:MAG TPA: hypothetical protein [Caudoviricetes sp.]